MPKQFVVTLTPEERTQLEQMLHKGKIGVRRAKRAQVLLAADAGVKDTVIAATVGVHVATVERIRRRCVLGGLEAGLAESRGPGGKVKLDGKGEAVLVALACSDPPAGHATWTMQMLADKLVELKVVDSISDETVRTRLKKTRSSRGKSSSGASRR